eukprot:SAG31_NODE_2287_length_6004_cov_2.142954_2_plen_112_part_00
MLENGNRVQVDQIGAEAACRSICQALLSIMPRFEDELSISLAVDVDLGVELMRQLDTSCASAALECLLQVKGFDDGLLESAAEELLLWVPEPDHNVDRSNTQRAPKFPAVQ